MRTMLLALALVVSGCAWTNRGSVVGHHQAAAAPAPQASFDPAAYEQVQRREAWLQWCRGFLTDQAACASDPPRAQWCAGYVAAIDAERQRQFAAATAQQNEQAQAEAQEQAEHRRAVGQAVMSGVQEFARAHAESTRTTTTNCTPNGAGGVRCVTR